MPKLKCYECKNVIENKEDMIKYNISEKIVKNFHSNCLQLYINNINKKNQEKELKQKICEQEKELKQQEFNDWCKLYEYVKKEIFQLSLEQSLSKHTIKKLKEMRKGQYNKNKTEKSLSIDTGYDFNTILLTFKIKKQDILYALRYNQSLKTEIDKTNYIMAIISNSINDVINKKNEKEKSKERMDNMNIEIRNNDFKNKTDLSTNKVANILSDLF